MPMTNKKTKVISLEILEHQKLEMRNVLSYRGWMTPQDVALKSNEIEAILKQQNTEKDGAIVTATYSVQDDSDGAIMDSEILVPLTKGITPPSGYTFIPHFCMEDAVMLRHTGNPITLEGEVRKLNEYMQKKHIKPTTVGYNVTVRAATNMSELDAMVIDIYVGTKPLIIE